MAKNGQSMEFAARSIEPDKIYPAFVGRPATNKVVAIVGKRQSGVAFIVLQSPPSHQEPQQRRQDKRSLLIDIGQLSQTNLGAKSSHKSHNTIQIK